MAEEPGVVPEGKGRAVRDVPEEGIDRAGCACASPDSDHTGEPGRPDDHAGPREPDGAVRIMPPGTAQDEALAL